MSTRDSIQLAIKTIEKVNHMASMLRNAADAAIGLASDIDGLTAIQSKLDVLLEGLTALGVNVQNLNTDKISMVNIANYIKSNVSELTDF